MLYTFQRALPAANVFRTGLQIKACDKCNVISEPLQAVVEVFGL